MISHTFTRWTHVLAVTTACFGLWTSAATAAVTGDEARQVALELMLSPEALTVAGMDGTGDVSAMLARIAGAESEIAAFTAAKTARDQAGATLATLSAVLAANPEDTEVVNAHQTAETALANAQAAFQSARDDLLDIALDGVSQQTVEALAVWRASAGYAVPSEFRVAERTPAQWSQIESALRAEQRANRLNQPLDSGYAQLLNDVRGELDVVAAQTLLGLHLATVEQAFAEFSTES